VDVSFEELAALTDQEWALLFRAAEQPIVMLALTGASEQLLQRITRRLSRREAQQLRERLEQTGPLRLSDIEQAQRHLAGLAAQLMARGQIKRPERRGFAAAA
jgi:flagellar motor switch protein FliG